ncbi:cytochrome P450 [Oceaniovalibus sp. ACAM 378]|uniref:cytochrome P450 n=1 Tax=Oceaniovalibus sp. ACAM 378 TaxID=2599923 RepID=UPI0011D938F0|nr:cytochrome P450 [Oceaniovalibus sp. ACAM 378]TYB85752.1 cytochrome P450 [Oceaniovalibus sp. ACAM 378]
MTETPSPDWDPRTPEVQSDQRATYDRMRETCPVAFSDYMQRSLFRHADVKRAVLDHDTFSNVVSTHLTVPNGMDPPEHTLWRPIVEKYFSQDRVDAFEPLCRAIVADLIATTDGTTEFMDQVAHPFAVRAQCAFLGWPVELSDRLRDWVLRNHQATLARDHAAMTAIAGEFRTLIRDTIAERIADGATPETDVAVALTHERVDGRPVNEEEIVSILRNWTVGEIGTIAASLGIIAEFLSRHRDVQDQLRADPAQAGAAADEILRLHGPLVTNRRITTCPVDIADRRLASGARVTVNWMAANRDPRVFDDPGAFRLDRKQGDNLLYGAGIHVCPGAFLARMELRVFLEELLSQTSLVAPDPANPSAPAAYPASGFSQLHLRLT